MQTMHAEHGMSPSGRRTQKIIEMTRPFALPPDSAALRAPNPLVGIIGTAVRRTGQGVQDQLQLTPSPRSKANMRHLVTAPLWPTAILAETPDPVGARDKKDGRDLSTRKRTQSASGEVPIPTVCPRLQRAKKTPRLSSATEVTGKTDRAHGQAGGPTRVQLSNRGPRGAHIT